MGLEFLLFCRDQQYGRASSPQAARESTFITYCFVLISFFFT
jgi:hypothetical protein